MLNNSQLNKFDKYIYKMIDNADRVEAEEKDIDKLANYLYNLDRKIDKNQNKTDNIKNDIVKSFGMLKSNEIDTNSMINDRYRNIGMSLRN